MLTPDNIWIIGIAQDPSTRTYYLVFYYDVHAILDRLIQIDDVIVYMPYTHFDEIKEIGSGGYGTVYTAEYKSSVNSQTVVLKRFKNFNETPELFISEVSNH